MSLRWRLPAVLLPLVILPILGLGLVGYIWLRDVAESRMRHWAEDEVRDLRVVFQQILKRTLTNIAILEQSPRLRRYLVVDDELDQIILFQNPLLDDFDLLQSTSPDHVELRLLQPDGSLKLLRRLPNRQAQGGDAVFRAEIQPLARGLRAGAVRWRLAQACDRCPLELWILRSVVIRDWISDDLATRKARIKGVLVATVDLSDWTTSLDRRAAEAPGSLLAIMRRSGELLYAPGWGVHGLDALFPEAWRRRLTIERSLPMTEGGLRGRLEAEPLVHMDKLGEDLFLLAVVLPDQTDFVPSWLIGVLLGLTGACVLLFAFAHQMLMTRMVLRPLGRLAARAEAIGNGETERPIVPDRFDELGQLASALDRMRTNLNAYQLSLRKKVQVAEAANRSKSEFLATISHELRTPLNGVLGATQLMESADLSEEQSEYLQIISQTGTQLLAVIDDLLDFSRLNSESRLIRKAEFDLCDVMETVIDLLAERANEKNIELFAIYSARLPRRFLGDRLRIQQILQNLLGNALKFTPSGQVVVRLEPECRHDAVWVVRLSVADTGIGIAADALASIFEPFTQVDTGTTRVFEGTGLGLAICRRLSELLGGEIGVDSTPGDGTTFRVVLPLETAADSIGDETSELGSHVPTLIVSDSSVFREAAEQGFVRNEGRALTFSVANLLIAVATEKDGLKLMEATALLDGAVAGRPELLAVFSDLLSRGSVRAPLLIAVGPAERLVLADIFKAMPVAFVAKPVTKSRIRRACVSEGSGITPVRKPAMSSLRSAKGKGYRGAAPICDGRKVLLVEDNPINQRVARTMLEDVGCRVETVSHGTEALQSVRLRGADLVLLDCHLPGMDGFKVAQAIRQLERGLGRSPVPIIALTANVVRTDREACLEVGMNDYLPKPLRKGDLERAIRQWLPGVWDGRMEKADGRAELLSAQEPIQGRTIAGCSPERTCGPFPLLDLSILASRRAIDDSDALCRAHGSGRNHDDRAGEEEGLQQLVGRYLDATPDILSGLGMAAEKGDTAKLRLYLRQLEQISAQIGLIALAERCRTIEGMVVTGQLLDPVAAALEIERLFAASADALLVALKSPPVKDSTTAAIQFSGCGRDTGRSFGIESRIAD